MSLSNKDISQVIEWAFRIPTFYGLGAHWELSAIELKDLTEKTRAVLDQFPDTILEKYGAVTSKFFAPVSLIISVATLCFARYQQTLLLKKYELSSEFDAQVATGANGTTVKSENTNSSPFDAGNGSGQGQNTAASSTYADELFGRTQ